MITFLLGTQSHGRGGHFWDVIVIAEELSKHFDVQIVNLGKKSPVLEQSHLDILTFSPLQFSAILKKLKKCEYIFAVDLRVTFIGYLSALYFRNKLIQIKPGGPNESYWTKGVQNLIVFSRENEKFVRTANIKNVELIPNRVNVIEPDYDLLNELDKRYVGLQKILLISRITKHYQSNLFKAIELANELLLLGRENIKLIVLGQVEDFSLYNELKKIAPENVDFITDTNYTKNAAKLIPMANIVIGNGRTVMESASLGIPILVNSANNRMPSILSPENFESFFRYNFSPRSMTEKPSASEEILAIFDNKEVYENISENVKKMYEEYFSVNNLTNKYSRFMKNCKTENLSKRILFILALKYVKFVLRSFK